MRSLPTAITAELAKEYLTMCHCFTLTVGSTVYRWTDFDRKLNISGYWYLPKGITFSELATSTDVVAESVTIEIDNVDKAFSDIVLATDIRGSTVCIYRALLDSNLDPLGTITLLFQGYVDQINIDRDRARVEVFSMFIKWRLPAPRRLHSATCVWTFKGTECGYGGVETWCDKSYARCKALAKTGNFGGFRWVSELADKEITWGTKSKVFVPNPVVYSQGAGMGESESGTEMGGEGGGEAGEW